MSHRSGRETAEAEWRRSRRSYVRWHPVRWFDESDLLEQIRRPAYSLHGVDQRVLVLDVERAVVARAPEVVDEVGPERRAAGMAKAECHVIPGSRRWFGDGHGVQQSIARGDPVVDANVLGVDVEDGLTQGPDHRRDIRAHPHQVRGVEVRADDVAAGRLAGPPQASTASLTLLSRANAASSFQYGMATSFHW